MTDEELSGHDLQRSPEQDPEHHRRSSALLQDAVTAVAQRYEGASEAEAAAALEAAVADRGLDPQPARWVEAAASAAVAGRVYVVNEQAVADTGTEHPQLEQVQHPDRSGPDVPE